MKRCRKCGIEKSSHEFHKRAASKDGLQDWCKSCDYAATQEWNAKNRDRRNATTRKRYQQKHQELRAQANAYRAKNRAKAQAAGRKYWHRLTAEEFQALIAAQDGLCASCKRPLDLEDPESKCRPEIDHDHDCCPGHKSCGQCIRGILCMQCNRGLGYFRDDPEALRRAANYLEERSLSRKDQPA